MHRDDLTSQVRTRARLHGRNEARRVIQAVLEACRELVPDRALQQIAGQLPPGLSVPRRERDGHEAEQYQAGGDACRALLRHVARRLNVDPPNAAFLARVVFERLNSYCQGVTPASISPSLPAEVRPLFSARADDPARRYRDLFPAFRAAPLGLLAAPRTDSIMESAAALPRRHNGSEQPLRRTTRRELERN